MVETRLTNVEDVYPLTAMQQGMLYHTVAEPGSVNYIDLVVVELSGDLDLPAFRRAWDDLVARHATLRTAFLWDGVDEPLQVVRERVELEWDERDLTALDDAEREAAIAAALRDARARGFDPAVAPLTRMLVMRTAPDRWRWVWSMHHAIADGWSVEVLLDEAFELYRAHREGTPPDLAAPFPYRDFIEAYTARSRSGEERFWRDRLAGFTEPHGLEVPGLPPADTDRGPEMHRVPVDRATSAAIKATAAAHRVTLNTVLVGAWSLVLSRWMRTADAVFGVTVAGRPADLAGVERGVGLFINTLPLRVDVSPTRRVGEWLRDVQRSQLEAQRHDQASLAAIQRWSDIPSGSALFESIVVVENYPHASSRRGGAGLTIGDVRYIESSNYPLAVLVETGDELELIFVHDTARLSARAVRGIAAQLLAVLEGIVAAPEARLADVRVLPGDDAAEVFALGRGPDLTPDDRTIHELIAAAAARTPDAAAVSCGDRSITYAELEAAAGEIAVRLAAAGAGPGRLVGLFLPRSIELVAGMLGILQAGAAYVPLDPAYPAEHIRGLLSADDIGIVLTDAARRAAVAAPTTVVLVDDPAPASPPAPRPAATADDLAYVIHTSGSTGRPKGVMVTHRNLVASTLARPAHYGEPVGAFLLLSSFAFDSSVAGIFWSLTTGGTLVLPEPGLELDADALVDLAARHHVTHTLCLPSVYRALLDSARDGQLASLRVAIVAGEACPPGIVDAHQAQLPAASLHNEYGPTEGTVWAIVHQADEADRGAALPIGRPIAGAWVFLLDEYGSPVPLGFPGELCIAGAAVSTGYLGRPDLTAERFASIDLGGDSHRVYRTGDLAAFRDDGVIEFLGRIDHQLKIRGHRVEPGAVAAALRELPGVRDAVVTGRTVAARGGMQLVAYVVGGDGFDAASVAPALGGALPAFMVPDVVVPLPELPRLANGKVDLARLPGPEADDGRHVEPRSAAEATLASIWAELLGLDEVGVQDDFFALGGDSIVSLQMISRARRAGIDVQPGQILTHPTVAALAAASPEPAPSQPAAKPVTGPVRLGPIQRWFFELGLTNPAHWNQSGLFEVPADVDVDALQAALQAVADRHEMLRARYERTAGEWRQVVGEPVAVALEIVDAADLDVDAIVAARQAGIDLAAGPLFRPVLIRRGPALPARLALVVHHLVVDVVSWGILSDEIDAAYRQAAAGDPVALAPPTTPFRDWVEHLAAADRSGEAAYWSQAALPAAALDAGPESSRAVVTVELDAAATAQLLTTANDAYQTTAEDLLVAALADVAATWVGPDAATFLLEGHGRPTDVPGVDLSGTVGWFSTLYPVTLPRLADDGALIKTAKERLRAVPDRGIGYGALRYLARHPDLVGQPLPSLSFNYLGRTTPSRAGGVLQWLSWLNDTARGPTNPRPHLLEVVAEVRDGALVVRWHHSDARHDQAAVAALAGAHLDRLRRLLAHCASPGTRGFTPSDFPEAGLSQDELDRFLDELA